MRKWWSNVVTLHVRPGLRKYRPFGSQLVEAENSVEDGVLEEGEFRGSPMKTVSNPTNSDGEHEKVGGRNKTLHGEGVPSHACFNANNHSFPPRPRGKVRNRRVSGHVRSQVGLTNTQRPNGLSQSHVDLGQANGCGNRKRPRIEVDVFNFLFVSPVTAGEGEVEFRHKEVNLDIDLNIPSQDSTSKVPNSMTDEEDGADVATVDSSVVEETMEEPLEDGRGGFRS